MAEILQTAVGVTIGSGVNRKVGFHGSEGGPQRKGAAQAAVTATVASDIAEFTDPPAAAEMVLLRAFVNALKVDNAALIVLVNELRAALVEKAIIKGSS